MKTKVGSPGDDPERTRRFAIAIPTAIAITALLVGLERCQPPDRTVAEQTPATTIVIERAAPTPRPTPKPTAPPTLPPVVRVTIAPEPQRVAAAITHRSAGGAHTAQRAVPQISTARTFAAPNAGGGNGTSVAAGTGEGTGTGDSSGAGDTSGGSTVNADAPCGHVDLIPFQNPDRRGSTVSEYVRATVSFPDGHTQSEEFPYRFVYTDPADDPWSAQNMRNDNFLTLVQLPPPSANPSRFPELIRYILNHTRQNGRTVLQECPQQR
jgi:hypothetical protein